MRFKRLTVAGLVLVGGMACRFLGGLIPPDAEQAITGFSGEPEGVEDSFLVLEQLIDSNPDEIRAAALQHLGDEDPGVRYAALYALAQTAQEGESMQSLAPYLSSEDISERMLAAQALLVRGDKSAFPVLIEALDSDEYLAFRDPPEQAWEAAVYSLIQFTNEDLGLLGVEDLEGSAAAKEAWQAWWDENGANLRWNDQGGYYE